MCLFCQIQVHLVEFIGPSRALALPGFHSFSGADNNAAFFNKGKKHAWNVWNTYPAATKLFRMLSTPIEDADELKSCDRVLHGFVNRLYGIKDVNMTVDEARLESIVYGGKDFTNIPPSSDALNQKVRRAAYQV